MTSRFGRIFSVTTFGESHGGGVGVVVDGCPPRLRFDPAVIQRDLDRRRPGQSRLTTPRQEEDRIEVLSGVFEGFTLGSPIAMWVRNKDARPEAYTDMKDLYRPSHADYTTEAKYGVRNWQGGGRASARETIGRVAAGALARALLAEVAQVEVLAWVSQVHEIEAEIDANAVRLEDVEANLVRCPEPTAAAAMERAIDAARRRGDSLGGVVTCVARRVPAGLGEPVFDKLDADLAAAMLSLPAAKGFEIGSGFSGTRLTGSEHNDAFLPAAGSGVRTATNRSGGVQGGISNGETICFRTAFKPTATIRVAQDTVTTGGDPTVLEAGGRHDPCVL
ncbi:MAG: chorismate synthase, partial [Myxococcales bacterium]|nr:chorismate synthase [Myxococcales bacterium]